MKHTGSVWGVLLLAFGLFCCALAVRHAYRAGMNRGVTLAARYLCKDFPVVTWASLGGDTKQYPAEPAP